MAPQEIVSSERSSSEDIESQELLEKRNRDDWQVPKSPRKSIINFPRIYVLALHLVVLAQAVALWTGSGRDPAGSSRDGRTISWCIWKPDLMIN